MVIRIHAVVLATFFIFMVVLPAQADEPAAEGDVFVVQQSRGTSTVSLGGTVIPYKDVTLSAQMPGRVKYLAGIEGDAFSTGDLLVALDETELLAKRQAVISQFANAEAQLRNASVQYSREIFAPRSKSSTGGMGIPNLFDQMFTAPMDSVMGQTDQRAERSADLYSSGYQITTARNAIMRIRSEIQAIDAKLRDTRSVAPFDGVITEKYIEVGDTVQPGMPLIEYADVEYLQVMVDVPARMRPGLNEGMMLRAELDIEDQVVPVRVAQIYPMADAQRHTVKVKFDLPQGVSSPGMYVKVLVPDFNAPTQDSPVIPTSAIRYNGSLPGVYVIGPEGKPSLRLIRVGESLTEGYTTVLSGLKAGERILRHPGGGLASGWTSSGRGRMRR